MCEQVSRHSGHVSSVFNARGTLRDLHRHILILEVNNVPTDLGSGHLCAMQYLLPGLQISVLDEDGEMFFTPLSLLWKLRRREDVRAVQIHRQSHGYVTFLPVHTGEFSMAGVPG